MMVPTPVECIINYSCYQDLYKQFDFPFPVRFVEGISSIDDLPQDKKPRILAIDDNMAAIADSQAVADLYTKYSHHLNYSVIILVQNLYVKGKQFRNISLNTQYMWLLKNVRDNNIVKTLGNQMGIGNLLHQMYMDATKIPFGHLFVNLKSDCDEKARFRTQMFDKPGAVYLAL